ncbi:phospholipase D-like domain-containing protein [Alicyclobacillus fastidiosus]|uniref:phospholipase D n=1 Tax=Alicyclobacillus fastidiosus TaxID=392011 RepID=A0ABV5AEW2_9BACL|nr:phosphatidylserine/phosphatidylglycerophosphate/cardiolipin synthase family protein [Alicyclobacillus fastidiosus]WEH08579.1 phosphatidylserine/phosphatidylglycerophosphate/cardiolipin synthase family protein [Alicyclobacillus fastidiosus]
MHILQRFQRFLMATAICAGMISVTAGCGTQSSGSQPTTQRVLPVPVTDSDGMELLWGPDVKGEALKLIQTSHHYIYLDMYELSDPDILKALVAAHHRGVDIRVVLDATEQHSNSVGYPTLRNAGVTVSKIEIKRGIDHVKMLVTDAGTLIGGMNYGQDSWNNNDASVLVPHPTDEFKAMFLWDFNRANGDVGQAPVLALPLIDDHSIRPAVLEAIQSARKTIDMEAFDLSDKGVIDGLRSALARGVAVSVLVDPTQSYNRTSVSTLRDAGAMVRYYRPYNGELMHAKILDVDNGATFIIGSANFSHQAFTYNHEADLELHDVPQFDASFRQDLEMEMGRGSDYPMKRENSTWN